MTEEFDTSNPVAAGLDDDYFAIMVTAFLAHGQGRAGMIGAAPSVLVEAAAITAFAVDWLEARSKVTSGLDQAETLGMATRQKRT